MENTEYAFSASLLAFQLMYVVFLVLVMVGLFKLYKVIMRYIRQKTGESE